jgi:hypothetical protein
MTRINLGHTLHHERFEHIYHYYLFIPFLLKKFKYDTVRFYRDYYSAPANYILVYNDLAAVPTYIIVYSYGKRALQIRAVKGDYCLFHNEYHSCGSGCDGHGSNQYCMTCGSNCNGAGYGYEAFDKLTNPSGCCTSLSEILEILGDTTTSR